MYNNLPEFCYATLPSNEDEIIIIKRGEKGYYRVDPLSDVYLCSAERNNELIGVTKAQAEAMKNGSVFGFDTPSANPDNYDENGRWVKKSL
jgi:hypothetical protein